MKKAFLSFAILAMIFLSSCTKPEAGPVGPQGPAGTNGTNGTNGINGNANVIGSNTIVINNWTAVSNNGTYFTFNSTITWTTITQAIVDRGTVVVYMQDGSSWLALPYTEAGQTGSLTLGYRISVGVVTLICTGYSNTTIPTASSLNGDTFRVVAIPASVATANPNVNWENYEDVMKILN
jgi:hypothetical protein